MKKLSFIYSVITGLLLGFAWPISSFTASVFFAFVPLLYIANNTSKKVVFFWQCFIALFIWNVVSTWWIWNSTDVGSVFAIVANSLLMCIPWLSYYSFAKKNNQLTSLLYLICCWMLFEYIHLNWQLSWPWLSLGNIFANNIQWIQWYEFTGVGGGTLWILLTNASIYYTIVLYGKNKKLFRLNLICVTAIILLPIVISVNITPTVQANRLNNNVVIVQPNIDPYQKFESNNIVQQIERLIHISRQASDSTTRLIIWPETALSATVEKTDIANNQVYQPIFNFLRELPNAQLLTGIETFQIFGNENARDEPYIRKAQNGLLYKSYNAAVLLDTMQQFSFYIKSKLVPGVETLPSFLNILAPVFEQFGGTTGGYAKDTGAVVFQHQYNPYKIAPVICYESIYGAYVASYIQKGANMIAIITNDGWWGNTPGHKQHLAYASLRAIETRRFIARSANTGISAVIDKTGAIVATKPWVTQGYLQYQLPLEDRITFYVRFGDYLYQLFSGLAILFVVYRIYRALMNKRVIHA